MAFPFQVDVVKLSMVSVKLKLLHPNSVLYWANETYFYYKTSNAHVRIIILIALFAEQKKQVNFRRSLLTPPRPPKVTIPPIKVIKFSY